MEDEVRNAPPVPRQKMNSKVTSYKQELLKLKRSVVRLRLTSTLSVCFPLVPQWWCVAIRQ
jgi:hypothetical protein